MKPFKDIVQPIYNTKKILRIIAPVEVPVELNPEDLFDAFYNMCEAKGWKCNGGGVQFPDDETTIGNKVN